MKFDSFQIHNPRRSPSGGGASSPYGRHQRRQLAVRGNQIQKKRSLPRCHRVRQHAGKSEKLIYFKNEFEISRKKVKRNVKFVLM